jgi:baculoviral IAP repeat-containing protein 6
MIFVDDPYFNEPGYQGSKGTPSGDKASIDYNTNIRFQTLKWAVHDMIHNPPVEFAGAVREHFRIAWTTLKKEYLVWIEEQPLADKKEQMLGFLAESEKILFN